MPVLTVVLGGLDGFNPCAMWTLLFLRGMTFIVASAFVYFPFMTAWLNLLLFVVFIAWVRLLIGLVALGGGGTT